MQALSGTDASFLYLETDSSPMHIGGLYIMAPLGKDQKFNFEEYKAFISSRLQVSRIFRQRIVKSSFNVSHPYWVEDPDFNLENHLFHMELPQPGGRKELLELAQKLYAQALNLERPLWETYIFENLNLKGYPKGSWAMMTKVHHAAIDGESGVEMLKAFYDLSATPRKMPQDTWKSEPLPSSWALAAKGMLSSLVEQPQELGKLLGEGLRNSGAAIIEGIGSRIELPPAPLSAPKTIFNADLSSNRVFDGLSLSLKDVKRVKNIVPGTTVNDVVLSICSGALRRYLEERNALPENSLIAMCPKSVRPEEQKQAMGNMVSAMLVSLSSDEADPIERLQLIRENTMSSKVYSKGLNVGGMIDLIPASLSAGLAKTYQNLRLSNYHNPLCNVVISNVAGPPMPLYGNSYQLVSHDPLGILTHGMGLFIAVFSYNGQLMISATSTREIMPDVAVFLSYIQDELVLLLDSLPLEKANISDEDKEILLEEVRRKKKSKTESKSKAKQTQGVV